MTHAHNVRVSARTAELTAADEGAWRFGGVAVGENDILYTDDGTPVLFTPEVLAEYAETQAGEPLSIDHPADEEGSPIYPPPVDEAPGKVPKAGYVPGQGLVYEATTHDETIANGVKAGSYEVSVHPTFDLGEQDPETGAYIPENVDFLDLSVVSKGMSPSNTAEWGANASLASWTRQADIGAELEASAEDVGEEPPGWFRKWASKMGLTASADAAEEGEGGDEQTPDEGADTSTDADADADADTDQTMEDEPTEETEEQAEGEAETEEVETETTPETNVVEVDIGEHDSIDAYLETKIADQLETATAQKEKSEKVEEIIANDDDLDEEDREELMASSEKLIEREHKRVTGEVTASLPGSAGARRRVQASEDDPLETYGTGMQE